ncbi:hypothetical protein BG011_002174, partial [Mortierella polycephala]
AIKIGENYLRTTSKDRQDNTTGDVVQEEREEDMLNIMEGAPESVERISRLTEEDFESHLRVVEFEEQDGVAILDTNTIDLTTTSEEENAMEEAVDHLIPDGDFEK